RLVVGDAARGYAPAEPRAEYVHVLQAVQERENDAVGDRSRVDELERLLERRRLHGHEEEADRLLEPIRDFGTSGQRLALRLDHEPGEGDDPRHLGRRDADRAYLAEREPDGEGAAYRSRPAQGDGSRHAHLDSSITVATLQSGENSR